MATKVDDIPLMSQGQAAQPPPQDPDQTQEKLFQGIRNIRLLRPTKDATLFPVPPQPQNGVPKANIAFAFSGGGIRSAAQCAGVIDAVTSNGNVTDDNVKIVSCVSGGGYLGSALVHHQSFKPFPQNSTHFDWESFFKHFRGNHGYMCKCEHILTQGDNDWKCYKLWKTIVDVGFVIGTFLLWSLTVLLTILPTATLYAELVNYVAGPYLTCSKGLPLVGYQEPSVLMVAYAVISIIIWAIFKGFELYMQRGTRQDSGHHPDDSCGMAFSNFRNTTSVLLVTGFLLLTLSLAQDGISAEAPSNPALKAIYDWFNVSLLGFCLVYFAFKGKKSLEAAIGWTWILLSFYTYVLAWKVKGDVRNNFSENDPSKCNSADFAALQRELSVNCTFVSNSSTTDLGCPVYLLNIGSWKKIPYSEQTWNYVIYFTVVALFFHPFLVQIRNNIWHWFYTNSLVAAFYYDPFKCGKCLRKKNQPSQNPKTRYVGGMVINQWQDHPTRSYGPLTAENIGDEHHYPRERRDINHEHHYPRERRDINHMQWGVFESEKIKFKDHEILVVAENFPIDNAMGASGAAVASNVWNPQNTAEKRDNFQVHPLQQKPQSLLLSLIGVTLGTIGYARDTDSYLKRSSDFLFWIPLSLLFFFQHFLYNGSSVPERSLMLYLMPSVGFFLVLFLTMNPLLSKEKPCQDKCPLLLESSCNKFNNIAQTASTCLAITQAFHMRFVSDPYPEQQATPPAVFLADGGHYENSGLLYLMEQLHYGELTDFKYIIFVNGEEDERMTGMLLLQAMETSRRHYGTAFLDETIYTDARAGNNPPGADFISRYRNAMASGDHEKMRVFKVRCKSTGGHEVAMYALNTVPEGPGQNQVKWPIGQDVRVQVCCCIQEYASGTLTERDLDCGCCCSCCHKTFSKLSYFDFMHSYPNHTTANQFFTTALYDMYHNAGKKAYKAMEAHIAKEL